MDYEKKYKNALTIAQSRFKIEKDESVLTCLGMMFPELREREDERIRKEIIGYFRLLGKGDGDYAQPMIDKWIAYLEKQKESLHISETCKENADSFTNEDEKIRIELLKDIPNVFPYEKAFRYIHWLEKLKENKEELVYRLNGLMQDYIKEGKDDEEKEHRLKCYQLFWDALEDANFFEQKEQKPALSEDDERTQKEIIDFIKSFWASHKVKLLQVIKWVNYLEK